MYDLSQRFPNNRSSLDKKALRILLEEWAAEKRILRDEIYEGLSIGQEEILLSEIAYDGMKDDHLFFDKRALSQQVREFLASNLNAPKGLDSEKVLNAIEVQQGILVERMENQYSFSHLTLQEYLTAQYLIDNNEWQALIQQHVTDNRWREVFLLLPGLMSGREGANRLLLTMKQQADECINTPRLKAFVTWAENAVDVTRKRSKPSANRSAAIFLVLARVLNLAPDRDLALALARNLDLNLTRDLDLNLAPDRDLARALARALAFRRVDVFRTVDFDELVRSLEELKNEQPSNDASSQEKQTFIDSIHVLWFSSLGIDPDVAALTSEEVQSLTDYLYVCELMIRCKEGATRVSPDVWEEIESSILTVPASHKNITR